MPRPLAVKLILATVIYAHACAAQAQNVEEMAAMRANCQMDYMRLCAGTSPGGPEVRACFKRNRANLSEGCSTAIGAYEARKAAEPPVR